VKTADGDDFPYNCPDARLSCLDAFQQNIGFVVAHPNDQSPIRTPLIRNLNLRRIRISKAYLMGLLGIVSLKIVNRISVC
jgi:hypothetical protein